jgi:hypothetical protein
MGRKTKYEAANDDIPEDEMTLAELIQNAAARGLKSCTGLWFDRGGGDVGFYRYGDTAKLDHPPEGATQCCVLGAQLLTPPVTHPLSARAYNGNDAADTTVCHDWNRDSNIGAAFEQALRE